MQKKMEVSVNFDHKYYVKIINTSGQWCIIELHWFLTMRNDGSPLSSLFWLK